MTQQYPGPNGWQQHPGQPQAPAPQWTPLGAVPPQSGPIPPPAPAPPRTPFWRTKKAAGLLLVGALMAACGLASNGSSSAPATPTAPTWNGASAAAAAPQAAAAPAASGPPSSFGPGTYEVGTDIAPGKYKTAGGGLGGSCYWARLKNTEGGFDAIIANGNAPGPTTVTINKKDGAFETTCDTWTKAG